MPETFTMQTVFTAITDAVTQLIAWMGTWLGAIVGNPLLMFFCIVLPIVGIGIGILKRLLRVRA